MTRGRPRDPATDTAILTAALDLFIDRGIAGMSMEQVAKRAGVGKPTVYRRWPDKERLIADAIETQVSADIRWPTDGEVATVEARDLVRRNIAAAAATAADPRFRGLVAQIYGSAVTHPLLMQTYWDHYILPRRTTVLAMLRRAQADGAVDADADLDVLIDMLAGAVTYRILQPNPPTARQMRRYLESLYRQVGLLE
ncbi:TetR/AcrR family transcriptional regulator C-terminal ligand-binding domain-containing protein [Mycolicibacterium flavescens]|uniref:TetR family transcriptional regulator n=1 Tax=Mycolicibacterium flavescens TaxID=1776 RepID=A0A1E3R9U8_MYCFV|nr:TetR/AcrR family transcriptional regulator [Mycolicibacterium flavescens]MCV7280014.1 TetR/AcrR family transcriptional regulator C-terminal ligand-binding domain-containing protein [Mycolicibacterium flavescens]ODQ86152.1 TetR family transcriptional regulator [Mycolicibacterium flavescens]